LPEEAVSAVSNDRSRAVRIAAQEPAIGTFLFLAHGRGQDELAKALAEFLFDDEAAMLRIDLSEYRKNTRSPHDRRASRLCRL